LNEFEHILNQLQVITLSEMDSVKLMDRTDTKFVFNQQHLVSLLNNLAPYYRVLEVNGNRISKYESLYFDTPDFDLYKKHHQGKLNRYKIRFRKYVESDLHYFEVKFKNNKGRTIKDRVKQKLIDGTINDKALSLLSEKTPLSAIGLEPKIWVNYSRITLVNKNSPERVTLDLGLHFKTDDKTKHIQNIVIAEVKQNKSIASPFIKLMRQMHIREGSISKYCFGIIHIFEQIKHNNFKPKLSQLNKISHATITSA
jgi:VTC domain